MFEAIRDMGDAIALTGGTDGFALQLPERDALLLYGEASSMLRVSTCSTGNVLDSLVMTIETNCGRCRVTVKP